MGTSNKEVIYKGLPVCRGIAFGAIFLCEEECGDVSCRTLLPKEIEGEVSRYKNALKQTRQEIKGIQKNLKSASILEGAAILETHLQMLKESLFVVEVIDQIRRLANNAEYVLQKTLERTKFHFHKLKDPTFRDKVKDLEDIENRLRTHLIISVKHKPQEFPKESIVCLRALTPSFAAEANPQSVKGMISQEGGSTTHAAIVAKAKGIPYISGISLEGVQQAKNAPAIVDGSRGVLIIHPSQATLKQYLQLEREMGWKSDQIKSTACLASETKDGHKISLLANIDFPEELDLLHSYGVEGVGLCRSELAFLGLNHFPTEEEQYESYSQTIQKLNGRPIVIRTFDIGGDKIFASYPFSSAQTSFLGTRALRFCLKEKELFRSQLRAILRASSQGAVSIMFPMVSALTELLEAKELLKEVQKELQKKKIPFSNEMRVGCMVEVPSAAVIADLLAPECDFLSIGTNDLIQYSLAVDRSDQSVSSFFEPTHPGILRLIKMTVEAANKAGIPVSVCGEVAADRKFVPLLIGLGVSELSVAARLLPEVRLAIRQTHMGEAKHLALEALKLSSAQAVEALLTRHCAPISGQ